MAPIEYKFYLRGECSLGTEMRLVSKVSSVPRVRWIEFGVAPCTLERQAQRQLPDSRVIRLRDLAQ